MSRLNLGQLGSLPPIEPVSAATASMSSELDPTQSFERHLEQAVHAGQSTAPPESTPARQERPEPDDAHTGGSSAAESKDDVTQPSEPNESDETQVAPTETDQSPKEDSSEGAADADAAPGASDEPSEPDRDEGAILTSPLGDQETEMVSTSQGNGGDDGESQPGPVEGKGSQTLDHISQGGQLDHQEGLKSQAASAELTGDQAALPGTNVKGASVDLDDPIPSDKVATEPSESEKTERSLAGDPESAKQHVASEEVVSQPAGSAEASASVGAEAAGDASGGPTVDQPTDSDALHSAARKPSASSDEASASVGAEATGEASGGPTVDQPTDSDALHSAQTSSASSVEASSTGEPATDGDPATPLDGKAEAVAPPQANSETGSRPASANTSLRASEWDQADRVRFVQRVARAFEALGERGGSVRLRLYPPELGSLRIEVSVRGGTMTARLEVESAAARTALLDNLPALRERLAEQDVKVGRFDVDLFDGSSGGSPERPHDQPQPRGRGNADGPIGADQNPEDEPSSQPSPFAQPDGRGRLDVIV
ncbi:MAG: flagellar hook-length control protein FliK [Planctomycetota bacterium]|jgi:flagellar hook-length control protein FliK